MKSTKNVAIQKLSPAVVVMPGFTAIGPVMMMVDATLWRRDITGNESSISRAHGRHVFVDMKSFCDDCIQADDSGIAEVMVVAKKHAENDLVYYQCVCQCNGVQKSFMVGEKYFLKAETQKPPASGKKTKQITRSLVFA